MRKRMTGVIVASVVLVAGAALAEPAPRGIIPVTGPSTVPSVPEPAKPEVAPSVAPSEVVPGEGARKGTASGPPAATAAHQVPRTVKAAPKPAAKATVKKALPAKHVAKAIDKKASPAKHVAKATVKKASPAKHVAKTAGTATAKPKHVVAVKHRPPAHHALVSKPIPVTKAKDLAPRQPVLPRV